ncbi:hypothetical protein BDA96_02G415700 [Sorghum bicolor]|uniref:Uncharacterized protein n=1 Tax=Sorghum bicolor TaxID=4558 RepID=A0A921RU00_SORBI|nr:hypothetical protein BDA96_02G415700 [Sorghum bicolor]
MEPCEALLSLSICSTNVRGVTIIMSLHFHVSSIQWSKLASSHSVAPVGCSSLTIAMQNQVLFLYRKNTTKKFYTN